MPQDDKPIQLYGQDARVIRRVLASRAVQNLIGAEEWLLTEDEEIRLWDIINRESKNL